MKNIKNFTIVTLGSLINKLSGLIRLQLTQKFLGTSLEADAFNFSFRMIGFFRSIFTDGSFYSFFSSYFLNKDKKNENYNFGFTLGVIIVFSSIFFFLNLLFILFPIFFTKIFLFSWKTNKKLILVSKYAKFMFPITLFMFFASIFSSILNSFGEFFHSSLGLILGGFANVFIIFIGTKYKYTFWSFVLGTVSYSFIHALYMGIVIYKKYFKKTKIIFVKDFFKKISSIGLTQLINQILSLFLGFLFIRMKTGSYSSISYAESLTYFIFMLVAGNLSNVITPLLAKSKNDLSFFRINCEKFFSITLFLVIFPTIFIYLQHDYITKLIFTSNKKTNLLAISLSVKYAIIGTPFWCLQRVILTIFNSTGNLVPHNISLTIRNVVTFFAGIFLYKYDYIGIIWGLNIGIISVVIYLLYIGSKNKYFSLNLNFWQDVFLKILVSICLCKYIFPFFSSNSIYFFFIKLILIYVIYLLLFFKDMKIFLKY